MTSPGGNVFSALSMFFGEYYFRPDGRKPDDLCLIIMKLYS